MELHDGKRCGLLPAVANGVVYVGSFDDKLYAINATTGNLLWNYTTGGGVLSSPALANGVVYVGSFDDKLYAINATTGNLLWNYTTNASIETSPAVSNSIVYFGSDYPDCNVYAIGNTTTLNAAAPSTASVNQNFTINGTLSADTTAIANANITLQRSVDNATWNNVTTNVTDANGSYQFINNESAAGTYYYRTAYDGNDSYANATSNTVNVAVSRVPITVVGAPAVAAQNANSLDLFVRGANGSIYWKHSTDGTTWPLTSTSLGGYADVRPRRDVKRRR